MPNIIGRMRNNIGQCPILRCLPKPLLGFWPKPLLGFWPKPLWGFWSQPLLGFWLNPLLGFWPKKTFGILTQTPLFKQKIRIDKLERSWKQTRLSDMWARIGPALADEVSVLCILKLSFAWIADMFRTQGDKAYIPETCPSREALKMFLAFKNYFLSRSEVIFVFCISSETSFSL